MSNIENQNIENTETTETNQPEQGIDMNERADATGQPTSELWEGEIDDLPDQDFEPAGNEVTMSYAHENVSATEFENEPDTVTEDFNAAAEGPESNLTDDFNRAAGGSESTGNTEKTDTNNLDHTPPDTPDYDM